MDPMPVYEARVLGTIEHAPGTWNGARVGVFRGNGTGEEQVGEYERNYPSLLETFLPFRAGGRDLALYSPDYTCTRLMELPSCRDIGGEEPSGAGFCPVEFFVPWYVDIEYGADRSPPRRARKQMPGPDDLAPRATPVQFPATAQRPARTEIHHTAPVGPLTFHPFGFVAGCVWGDDSSWKLQYLDLSRAAEGVLRREERFGHLELPDGLPLRQAVDLSDYQYDPGDDLSYSVRITMVKRFDLRGGSEMDPFA